MCGRYSITSTLGDLWARFPIRNEDLAYQARFNIAPTDPVLAVINEGDRGSGLQEPHAEMLRWGLVPHDAEGTRGAARLINARSETAAGNHAFRSPIQRRRCIIVADGFYEWKKDGKARYPFRFVVDDGSPFGFAGVWDQWCSPETGDALRTCSILTTEANALVRRIHDRMPVILRPEDEPRWIDATITDPAVVTDLFAPYPADRMQAFAISTVVNSVRNDVPECIQPLPGGERLEP